MLRIETLSGTGGAGDAVQTLRVAKLFIGVGSWSFASGPQRLVCAFCVRWCRRLKLLVCGNPTPGEVFLGQQHKNREKERGEELRLRRVRRRQRR